MQIEESRAGRRDHLADRLAGAFWILFGLAIIVYAQGMDIRKHLGATFLTGPGLVPILLGAALGILGLVLITRSFAGRLEGFLQTGAAFSDRRALIALALMLVYSLGLVGRIDFGIATFLFITSFIVVFNLPVAGAKAVAALLAKAMATAAITAVVVVYTFHNLFYVRLP
ncbi:MAG: tripartite tricarboxylate transporter TctB family protein [Alphaproteobacteria bacterium]